MTSLRLSIAMARLPFPEQSDPLRPLLGKQPGQSLPSPLYFKSFSRQLVWGVWTGGRYDAGVSCVISEENHKLLHRFFFVRRSFGSNFSGLGWESECFWVKSRFQDIFRSLPGCPWARCSLVLTTLPQCFQAFVVESHILLKPVWKMSFLLFGVFLPLQLWWTQTPSDPWPTPLCCSDPQDRSARPTLRAGTHYA